MNKTGITRKVDNLGRVVIPKTYRDKLQIQENDTININMEDQILTMTKVEDSCLFCNSKKDLITFENKLICNKCCNKFLAKVLIK
jgi:transcriptional pleiotropic regulator of transition state genes